jgi:histidine triad (HIT) family protein
MGTDMTDMTDCIFCKIVAGSIPAKKVHEDEHCIAFHDLHPQAPKHLLFVPKRHIATLHETSATDGALLGHLLASAAGYARKEGFGEAGYRCVMNCNSDGGQTVFHIHLHLLAGRQLVAPFG